MRVVSKEQFAAWYSTASGSLEDANAQLTARIQSGDSVAVAGR
ncbi:hypothetical protein [Aurantimonas manganoxydans]|nr:hypothetical protein [Aurantimonas manganoxydans]